MKDEIFKKIVLILSELSQNQTKDLSLFGGSTGIAIFYAHLFELTGDVSYRDKYKFLVIWTIERLSRVKIDHSFCTGFSGVAWGIDYLIKKGFFEEDGADLFELLDDHIYQSAKENLYVGNYDFLHGGMGAVLSKLAQVFRQCVGMRETCALDR